VITMFVQRDAVVVVVCPANLSLLQSTRRRRKRMATTKIFVKQNVVVFALLMDWAMTMMFLTS